ncbi:DUF806 family protein [Lactobacillus sp. ESL0791]|uniref:DUF806 family protein n=1 Tax=Lactobacillus sp. ESL0791 TaxID=2983234 RepID=UPI0023F6432C|nr:DUF806 family protein [Lactobacillus sp. ESL0791]MDF7639961.1 DUF806 family protein [Lactobacillus sp. ESL0791]
MMPVDELAQDIRDLSLPWINSDSIATTNLSAEQMNDTANTIIFITESDYIPQYANSRIRRWLTQLELQIFWALEPPVNIVEAELDLIDKLEDLGWNVDPRGSHITDPNTQQLTKTIYLEKLLDTKKEAKK